MSRTKDPAILNLDTYQGETMRPSQAAKLLEIDIRAVRGLVRCGVLECKPHDSREYHIFTASVREIDHRQRAPKKTHSEATVLSLNQPHT